MFNEPSVKIDIKNDMIHTSNKLASALLEKVTFCRQRTMMSVATIVCPKADFT